MNSLKNLLHIDKKWPHRIVQVSIEAVRRQQWFYF